MNTKSIENQKARMINFRVDDETESKLAYLKTKSGDSTSATIRKLILTGEVRSIYNGKEIMRDIAELHKKINQYVMHIDGAIQKVKKDIKNVDLLVQQQKVENPKLDIYLERADRHLDELKEKFTERTIVCYRVLGNRGSNNGNF